MKEFAVPYRVTFDGDMFVEAESEEDAIERLERGAWDDDTFTSRANIVDWEVVGDAEEVE